MAKVAPSFKVAEFDIMYDQGISREGEVLDLGVGYDVITKWGSFYSYGSERLGIDVSVSDDELRAHELSYRPQRQRRQDEPFIPYRGVLCSITFTLDERTVTDRALVVWSTGKARLDQQKGKTYLKRLLDDLARIRGWMGKRRYTNRDYIVDGVQRGNPARPLVDVEITTSPVVTACTNTLTCIT